MPETRLAAIRLLLWMQRTRPVQGDCLERCEDGYRDQRDFQVFGMRSEGLMVQEETAANHPLPSTRPSCAKIDDEKAAQKRKQTGEYTGSRIPGCGNPFVVAARAPT